MSVLLPATIHSDSQSHVPDHWFAGSIAKSIWPPVQRWQAWPSITTRQYNFEPSKYTCWLLQQPTMAAAHANATHLQQYSSVWTVPIGSSMWSMYISSITISYLLQLVQLVAFSSAFITSKHSLHMTSVIVAALTICVSMNVLQLKDLGTQAGTWQLWFIKERGRSN